MSLFTFDQMPDTSRVWIFASDRKLTPTEADQVLEQAYAYLDQWKAHGAGVNAACELKYDQFLFVASDDSSAANPSGCSIDDMTRAIQRIAAQVGISFLPGPKVFYKENGEVKVAERPEFKALAQEGKINGETLVFDNTLISLRDIRSGKWELPARESWHQRLIMN